MVCEHDAHCQILLFLSECMGDLMQQWIHYELHIYERAKQIYLFKRAKVSSTRGRKSTLNHYLCIMHKKTKYKQMFWPMISKTMNTEVQAINH